MHVCRHNCMYRCTRMHMHTCKFMHICKHVCTNACLHECTYAWHINLLGWYHISRWMSKSNDKSPSTQMEIVATQVGHFKPTYQNPKIFWW
jgi:hypothetical protein